MNSSRMRTVRCCDRPGDVCLVGCLPEECLPKEVYIPLWKEWQTGVKT